jgi:hypothetical protein
MSRRFFGPPCDNAFKKDSMIRPVKRDRYSKLKQLKEINHELK